MRTLIKLAVFDCDSTLIDGETIEFLAALTGAACGSKVKEITDRAMNGELDFFESLLQRVALLKGLPVGRVNEVCANLPLMPGAKETVEGLQKLGYKVVCFSGGFKNATVPLCQRLGLDGEFSNILHEKDGVLTGRVGGEMMFGGSKGEMILKLQNLLGVDRTLVVGDGANDLSMFCQADISVAFCAKDVLKKAADVIIDEKDLRLILETENL